MTNLKRIEWYRGTSAHAKQQRAASPSATSSGPSLLRSGVGSRRLWDEPVRVEQRDRRR